MITNVLSIKANPKSYSAWFHRRWFIENYCGLVKEKIVEEELELLCQLLDLDCRNCKKKKKKIIWLVILKLYYIPFFCVVHGWNYRIWLTNWASVSVISEFDFTTLKIYQNFSNYSAWQRRSQLFPKYLDTFTFDLARDSFIRNEVEMCRNAAWTEPSDQSIWFYQRWLFTQLPQMRPELKELLIKLARDQVQSISELIEEEKGGESVKLARNFVNFLIEKEKGIYQEFVFK